ncbi:putative inactive 1-aminocyclopropane-1-carboxylate synthase-like protein 2 [Sciurus carolinensis]|uniref:Inactive 1-aminocyclopropane-1-carboxylate synthase-like protein 2 n=1 Tax=Sciurus carolinensis TaxID=30640 RepID=A0AA41MQE0_SCICA|nr:putative inactive 1-aminocyclopropane-1-carboxylate synthase-like protein 2 [Sciurus carolinensis]
MSDPSDAAPTPCDQTSDAGLGDREISVHLLEMMLNLQQIVGDHFTRLTTRRRQGLSLEEEKHIQVICEQEDVINHTMCQIISLLWSEATVDQKLEEPLLSRNSRRDGQRAREAQEASRQPDRPARQSDFEASFVTHVLSNRGVDISVFYQSHFQDYNAYQRDKYHEEKNPLGFLNLGISENKLCTDLMTQRLCRNDMNCIEKDLLQYPDWRGQPFLREEVARFLTYYCKAPTRLDPENVVVLNGCCSIFSALAMVLCDPGEAFLVPAPFYGGFAFSSRLYAKVELIPVHLESEITDDNTQPFQLTVDKLEKALLEARQKEKKVRGLVLTNPQNPLGDVYSRDSLMEYLEFATRHNLHVIIDEIYMLSVFDESITFHSVLSIESLPDPKRTHVIWGTSKDFGISGFRFGALYTHNREVASAVSAFGYLHSISGVTQYKLCRLLQDREWIDKVYLPANHSRLRAAHKYITKKLRALKIPFLERGSGLYVWVDLRSYLAPCTFEEELILHRRFLDNKLMLSCGKSYMCKEPGWFRVIFAENPLRLKLGEWGTPSPGILERRSSAVLSLSSRIFPFCFIFPLAATSFRPPVSMVISNYAPL